MHSELKAKVVECGLDGKPLSIRASCIRTTCVVFSLANSFFCRGIAQGTRKHYQFAIANLTFEYFELEN